MLTCLRQGERAHKPIKVFLWSLCESTKAREELLSLGNAILEVRIPECQLIAHFLYYRYHNCACCRKNKFAFECEASWLL